MRENKALMRRIVAEVFNQGNLEVVDQLFAEGYVHHGSGALAASDREGMKQLTSNFHTAFPDFHITIQDVVAEGDRVAVRILVRGTHQGALAGMPPTGRKVEFACLSLARIADGKLAEGWTICDGADLLRQIEAMPTQE